MQPLAVGIWTQRFNKITGAFLHVFGDVYTPSFRGAWIVIKGVALHRVYGISYVGANAYT